MKLAENIFFRSGGQEDSVVLFVTIVTDGSTNEGSWNVPPVIIKLL
jgi:hypothetical protein